MKFSKFAPLGHDSFKDGKPLGEAIFEDSKRNIGFDENFSDDRFLEGKLFADAMLSARIRLISERAKNEVHPLSTQTFLPLHEQEMGLAPAQGASDTERRRLVYAIRRLVINGHYVAIHAALTTLLGSKLALYRTLRTEELTPYDKLPPPTGSNVPGWQEPIRIMRLTAPVATIGASVTVPAEYVSGSKTPWLSGQKVLVGPNTNSRSEMVRISTDADGAIRVYLFGKAHPAGELLKSGNHPRYPTAKRMHFIVLTGESASDPSVQASIGALMRRLIKGTAIWQIMRETTPGSAGPFILDQSPQDATPFEAVTN